MNSEPALKQLEMKFDTDLPKTQQVKKLMNDLLNYVIGSDRKMRMCLNRYKDLIAINIDDKDYTIMNQWIIQIEISFDHLYPTADAGFMNLCYDKYPANKNRLKQMFIRFTKSIQLILYEIHLIRANITSLENLDRDDSPESYAVLADLMGLTNAIITHIDEQHKIAHSKTLED